MNKIGLKLFRWCISSEDLFHGGGTSVTIILSLHECKQVFLASLQSKNFLIHKHVLEARKANWHKCKRNINSLKPKGD